MGSLNIKSLLKGLEALTTHRSSFTLGWHHGQSISLLICGLVRVLAEHEAQKWERLHLFTPEDPDTMSCSLGHLPILLLARQAPASHPFLLQDSFMVLHLCTCLLPRLNICSIDTSRPNQTCPEKTLKLDFLIKNIRL